MNIICEDGLNCIFEFLEVEDIVKLSMANTKHRLLTQSYLNQYFFTLIEIGGYYDGDVTDTAFYGHFRSYQSAKNRISKYIEELKKILESKNKHNKHHGYGYLADNKINKIKHFRNCDELCWNYDDELKEITIILYREGYKISGEYPIQFNLYYTKLID